MLQSPCARSLRLARTCLPLVALLLIVAAPLAAYAADDESEGPKTPWVRDIAKAKAQAKAEGKDLLINFTGSDWCGGCLRLDEEVFSTRAFIESAPKQFVLLFVDFPRSAERKADVVDAKANEALHDAYRIGGRFPAVILATADGAPYARAAYEEGGAAAFLSKLADLRERGACVKALVAAGKDATAKQLDSCFRRLAEDQLLGWPGYAPLLEAAAKADPDGALGYRKAIQEERARQMASEERATVEKLQPRGQRLSDDDWQKLHAFLLTVKQLRGIDYQKAVFGTVNWLLKKNRAIDARGLLEGAAKHDPGMLSDERTERFHASLLERIERLEASDG
jgi:thioredoxin-related protein